MKSWEDGRDGGAAFLEALDGDAFAGIVAWLLALTLRGGFSMSFFSIYWHFSTF